MATPALAAVLLAVVIVVAIVVAMMLPHAGALPHLGPCASLPADPASTLADDTYRGLEAAVGPPPREKMAAAPGRAVTPPRTINGYPEHLVLGDLYRGARQVTPGGEFERAYPGVEYRGEPGVDIGPAKRPAYADDGIPGQWRVDQNPLGVDPGAGKMSGDRYDVAGGGAVTDGDFQLTYVPDHDPLFT